MNLERGENVLKGDGERALECAVCLQTCIHPVELPCSHIFCFLCVKGVANQSKKCALCRTEIPVDYVLNPNLLRRDDLVPDVDYDDGYQWFYQGYNGWWQYDQRTSQDLEERYKKGEKSFDLLIAGFLYVIDIDAMYQFRRNDPTRRRRIKRDLANIPKKGVAGIKLAGEDERPGVVDGDDDNVSSAAPPVPSRSVSLGQDGHNNAIQSTSRDHRPVPPPPSSTPHTHSPRQTTSSPDAVPDANNSDQSVVNDIAADLEGLSLTSDTISIQNTNLVSNEGLAHDIRESDPAGLDNQSESDGEV